MSANPRIVLSMVTYNWGEAGCSYTLPAGTILDCAPGSALELAIGSANLSSMSGQVLQDAAAGGAGGISN
jgi:hypothetical protein